MEFTSALVRGNQPDSPNERDFNVSDQGLDRHRSIIYADGWITKDFMKNPSIQYVHYANRLPDPDLVIGQATKLWFEDTVMASRARFDVNGEAEAKNALAIKVLYKVDNKFLRATSVGFDPIEHGRGLKENKEDPEKWYYRKQHLLEWSVVPVPSNPRALIRNLEEWRDFIDKEGLNGDDLDQYLKNGFQGAPLLYHLDGVTEENYRVIPPVHFHFDMHKILKEHNTDEVIEPALADTNKNIDNDWLDIDLRHRYLKLKNI